MSFDIQKASMWKRASAALLDFIVLCIVAVGFTLLIAGVIGYDRHNEDLNGYYEQYEADYGVSFSITEEEYNAMPEEDQKNYMAAYEALIADEGVLYTYNLLIYMMILMTTLSLLFSYLVLEFAAPLVLGNGQTLGKKIFGIAVVRNNSVKINGVSLFARTVLGKYTIETMIPVLICLMIFSGSIGIVGPLVILAIVILEIICMAVSPHNAMIHDFISNTVVVDMASQRIFESEEALLEYKKKQHADKAARQSY